MKSKKRRHSSSDDSEDSDGAESNTSSSESNDSSFLDQRQHKKKRKRAAESSESESESDYQRRAKKRKHKKKKKKHGKKKRHSASVEDSDSDEDVSSVSDGEISSKKKRKHKHKQKHSKRDRSSSLSVRDETREWRLHSVVKDRRASENGSPSRTYYQKEYRQRSTSHDYERESEVQRFYRGSSKDTRYQEHYMYDQQHADNRQGERYEGHRTTEDDYHRKQRDEAYYTREEPKTYNRYNQYEDSRAKRREHEEGRDYRDRERRAPPEPQLYRERKEYTERKDRYRDERYSPERGRDQRRERVVRTERNDRITEPQHKEHVPRSPDRYKERDRRPEHRAEREERYREERPARRPTKQETGPPERKTRFTDAGDNKEYSWGKVDPKKEIDKPGEKEKPNFGLSGKLTADVNTVNGVVIKYTEPDDAKQPKRRWRFYPFKGDKSLPILYIHRQSAFLLGRDKKVVDIALEHPSVSKQHAALQYRATPFTRPDGTQGRRVRPYVIDLESANGTFVNNKKIEPRRYVELLERDVVKFGFSQREYVLLHENSKDDALDDDQPANIISVATTDQIKQEKRVIQEIAEDGD